MGLNNKSFLSIFNFTLFVFTVLLISVFLVISCKQPTEPKNELKAELKLILEDVSCTEAWMKLTTTNLQLPTSITLKQNDITRATINLTTTDTLIYIDSLLPNRSYRFKAVATPISYPQSPISNELSLTTMDTTSHNFSWQSWEFGDDYCGSSSLYDVAIIDENNIWAVGEIYIRDSLGRCDPKAYNAVHWNGNKWELKRIPVTVNSTIFYPPITVICAFSQNDIWFGGVYWDGYKYTLKNNGFPTMPNGDGWQVKKLWGSSSSDLYAVGNNGNIAHWDGVKWRKIESGTRNHISNIYGVRVKNSDSYEILCTTNNIDVPGGVNAQVIKIVNNKTEILNTLEITTCCLKDIWFKPGKKYIVVGAGMWESNHLTKRWRDITLYPPTVKTSIAGNDYNDIIVVGSFQTVAHWNGYSWRNYFPMISSVLSSVEMKSNLVIVVGFNNEKGYIQMGKR
jgi:hypothetical protein